MERTVISIDWDFFVPEDVRWDFGHAENLMFLNMVWMTRTQLMDEMQTDGVEKNFWKTLQSHYDLDGVDIEVSDSHSYGYEACRHAEHLVLFDTHHDIWPWRKDADHVNCGNWARFWLMCDSRRRLTWVRSAHSIYDLKGYDDFGDRVQMLTWGEDALPEIDFLGSIHICRSGCWTPPWLDQNFIDFVNEGVETTATVEAENVETDEDWNPLKCRWNDDDLKQAKEMAAQLAQFLQKEMA